MHGGKKVLNSNADWNYSFGLGAYRINRELWMDWKNNDASSIHAEVDDTNQ
jgi:hypothetical protein